MPIHTCGLIFFNTISSFISLPEYAVQTVVRGEFVLVGCPGECTRLSKVYDSGLSGRSAP